MHVRCMITFTALYVTYNWRNVNDCMHAVSLYCSAQDKQHYWYTVHIEKLAVAFSFEM